jgi:hypothetical protein
VAAIILTARVSCVSNLKFRISDLRWAFVQFRDFGYSSSSSSPVVPAFALAMTFSDK